MYVFTYVSTKIRGLCFLFLNIRSDFSLQAALAAGAEAGLRCLPAAPRCLLTLVTEHPMLVVSPRVLGTEVTTETSETTRNTIGGHGGARSLSRLRESASPVFYSCLLSCFFYL